MKARRANPNSRFWGALLWCGLMAGGIFAFQISPSVQILDLKPGEKASREFVLTNTDGGDLKIIPEAKDWRVLPGNENFKAIDWLTFEKKEYPFKNGAVVPVRINIEVPRGAKGELIGAASFTMDEGIQSMLVKKLTSVVYVAVKGTEDLNIDLVAFQIDPTTYSVKAGVFLENKGNIHVRPEGWVYLNDSKGIPQANIQIHRGSPLFPGEKDFFFGTVSGLKIQPGVYTAKISITDADRGKDIVQRESQFKLTSSRKVELIKK